MDNAALIAAAKEVLVYRELTQLCAVGEASAALLTEDGQVYVGVSIDAACGIGFCAEHSAIAQMVTYGGSRILKIVAIASDGTFLPPCGRCRELIYQVNYDNVTTEVLLGPERSVTLAELLPERWSEAWG
ncbi:MAG: cytidine deaminase family protein [Anaerolineae bacterium]